MQHSLFPKEAIPRRAARKLMHVIDAGYNPCHAHMICDHCGYDDGHQYIYENTITELKRGLPCPICNDDKLPPLFIPLKGEYYDKFEDGSKDTEYRAFGARWNHKTCYPGRRVVLSRGYGKKRRMTAIIICSEEVKPSADFIKIYGDKRTCFAIRLTNIKQMENQACQ